jgi:hypothetical protein
MHAGGPVRPSWYRSLVVDRPASPRAVGEEAPGADAEFQCLYCHAPLTESTREAHVLAKFFSGRMAGKRTECSACNEFFAPMEEALGEALRPVSGTLGAVTGDRVKIFAELQHPEEGPTRLWRGLAETKLPAPVLTTREDGKRVRYMKLPRDDESRAKIIASGLFDDGKTVEDLDAGRAELIFEPWSNTTRVVDMGEFSFKLGGREQARVFTKMAVSLLGHVYPSAARSTYLEDARQYARYDKAPIEWRADTSSQGSELVDPARAARFAHGVEVWTCRGQLLAMVRFFGQLRFTAVLAGRWPRASVGAAYLVDPLGHEPAVHARTEVDGPPLGLVHEESADEMVRNFLEGFEAEQARIVAETQNDPSTLPPDPEKLKPMVRAHLVKLRKKHRGKKPRGGRDRKQNP